MDSCHAQRGVAESERRGCDGARAADVCNRERAGPLLQHLLHQRRRQLAAVPRLLRPHQSHGPAVRLIPRIHDALHAGLPRQGGPEPAARRLLGADGRAAREPDLVQQERAVVDAVAAALPRRHLRPRRPHRAPVVRPGRWRIQVGLQGRGAPGHAGVVGRRGASGAADPPRRLHPERARGAAVCDGEAAGDIHEQGPDVDLRHVQRQEAGRHAVRRLPARRQDHVRQEGVRLPMAAADHQPGLHRGGAR
mmetsp:Transcript_45371/g.106525  ORF Transcript_45371/g.106525 Transcript_45371/m.106525 type:complete len:250 (+) Transcript_45371:3889-4638(+)